MKKIIYILLLCVNIILISSIGYTQEVIHWRFQSHHPKGSLSADAIIPKFIQRVRDLSKGQLQISLHYAGELVDYIEVLPALQVNMIQMSNISSMFWRNQISVGWLQLSNLPPFVLRNYNDFEEVYYKRGMDELIREGLKEHGIHFLGTHSVGNTYFWANKPVHTIEDLKNLKIRFFGSMNDAINHFKGNAIMLSHPETYEAIEYGILDGSGTAWWLYKDLKLYEVCKYFMGPPWQTPQGMELWVSLKAWEALPDNLKNVVTFAAQEFAVDYSVLVAKQEKEMFDVYFPKWGTQYINWSEQDICRMTTEFSIPYLDNILKNIGSEDERVKKGILILKEFMIEKKYID